MVVEPPTVHLPPWKPGLGRRKPGRRAARFQGEIIPPGLGQSASASGDRLVGADRRTRDRHVLRGCDHRGTLSGGPGWRRVRFFSFGESSAGEVRVSRVNEIASNSTAFGLPLVCRRYAGRFLVRLRTAEFAAQSVRKAGWIMAGQGNRQPGPAAALGDIGPGFLDNGESVVHQ